MNGWLVVFIILCIVYGPLYVFGFMMIIASSVAPGTRDSIDTGFATLLMLALSVPFIFTGYMAFKKQE